MNRDDHDFEHWLAQGLRRESRELPDDGFSAGVMAALPESRPVAWWRRVPWLLLLAALILASLLGLLLWPLIPAVIQWGLTLPSLALPELLPLAAAALGCSIAAVALMLWWDGGLEF
ncbi:hypothetical protein [Marinimicrobium alkaliphilum]|uniref:hypothetical protein n=1 Tax=Marinimicrobium alkaliphilum TaxID=2202654 RepID=UPI000DB911C6|nr:hypothetical protein [Marinimicrobium alkaliphilum]